MVRVVLFYYMKIPKKEIVQVVNDVIRFDALKAVKFIEPNFIVRATRRTFGGKVRNKRGENIEINLTIGKPNYLEREFVKLARKAKEPFPVKKVQLKLYSPKKKKIVRRK